MRLLILSCNTGEGHNSAARAVKDAFEEQGSSCDIKDTLAYWSPSKSKFISTSHIFIYRRFPKLFGFGYRYEENHRPKKDGDESLIYEIVKRGCATLHAELQMAEYDAVVCTHVFSAMMMTEVRRRYGCRLKSYFVATDYTCSPGAGESELDGYFIPHRELIDEFASCGVDRTKLFPTGIPIRKDFYTSLSRTQARERLCLPQDSRILLMMGGSMGCGPIKSVAQILPSRLIENTLLIIICGSNRRLYNSLTKDPLPANVKILGYTKDIPAYFDAADLLLTKPGGLSTTEASVKNLPIVFIDAIPGCETRNRDFFIKCGYAQTRDNPDELCALINECLGDPELRQKQADALKEDFVGCASREIYEFICEEFVCKQ